MCLVQLLLIRSLVARFWKAPYKHKLTRWGTELYDKFMLPHYVEQDLAEVARDLQEQGYPFQLEWLQNLFLNSVSPIYGKNSGTGNGIAHSHGPSNHGMCWAKNRHAEVLPGLWTHR